MDHMDEEASSLTATRNQEAASTGTSPPRGLLLFNKICLVVHVVQAVACLAIGLAPGRAGEFRLPMTTTFAYFVNDEDAPEVRVRVRFMLHFTAVASTFSFVSALSHAYVLRNQANWFKGVVTGVNPVRWIEYAVSSSAMIMLIAAVCGMYDIVGLFLLGTVNASVMLMGYVQEVVNRKNPNRKKKPPPPIAMWPFWMGSLLGAATWVPVFVHLSPNSDVMPGFVWAIVGSYMILFGLFPLVMLLRYKRPTFCTAERAEYAYCVLSIVAKSLLTWLIVGGTNQPNQAGQSD